MSNQKIIQRYELAKEQYAALGVDVDAALKTLAQLPVSMHCWQGDDVGGFENTGVELSGGLQATGNYPGKARTIQQLRQDIEKALSLIPGKHRLNLHACYLDHGGKKVDRDQITIDHFQSWIDWAKGRLRGIDFNPTYFSHPKAADGFTLSHPHKAIRQFWIEHGKACRKIAAQIAKQMGSTTVTNFWIPDGYKDIPVDRLSPRLRLIESLDAIFAEPIDPALNLDSVESKLFGIGVESYTVGSHEFYIGYAVSRQKLVCLDAGHFHPTETIADKIAGLLPFVPGLLLHVSRPVRWDSDHVVILNDDLLAVAEQIVRSGAQDRIHIGLDFFDASINRIAAWVIGMRSILKALLIALLTPHAPAQEAEKQQDFTSRLAWQEEAKTLPWCAVWDYYCLTQNVPVGAAWLTEVKSYEAQVLAKR